MRTTLIASKLKNGILRKIILETPKEKYSYSIEKNYGTKVIFFSQFMDPGLDKNSRNRILNIKDVPRKIRKNIKNIEDTYIIVPWLNKLYYRYGLELVGVSRNIQELKEDILVTKTKIIISDTATIKENEKKLRVLKKEMNIKIIEIGEYEYKYYKFQPMPEIEEKDKLYLSDKKAHYDYGRTNDTYERDTYTYMISEIKKQIKSLKNYQTDEINNYLEQLFPDMPIEILEKISNQIHKEFQNIQKNKQQTYSGNVGKIYFEAGTKSYFFKVYEPKKKRNATIEFEIGKRINKDPVLKGICANIIQTPNHKKPLEYQGYTLILTEDVSQKPYGMNQAEYKLMQIFRQKTGINPAEETYHKLFVIAAIHARLKKLIKKEKTDEIIKRTDFMDWEDLQEMLARTNKDLEKYTEDLKTIYNNIVSKHSEIETSVIGHNDPKWDNFVNGYLIDFGSVHASTPYVDISRILLVPALENNFSMDKYIFAYIFFRANIDDEFDLEREIKNKYDNIFINTYERLISESLRIGRFKAITGNANSANTFFLLAITLAYKVRNQIFERYIEAIKLKALAHIDQNGLGAWQNKLIREN